MRKNEQKTKVPTRIHTIWFGSLIPNEENRPYQKNCINRKLYNPSYGVYLWFDSKTLNEKEQQEMTQFAVKYKILLMNIREFTHLPNYDVIVYELDLALQESTPTPQKVLAWTRASDIARIDILLTLGGIYTDADLPQTRSFGQAPLEAEYGILARERPDKDGNFEPCVESFKWYFQNTDYCIQAAVPGNIVYKTASSMMRINFQTLLELKKTHPASPIPWEVLNNKYMMEYVMCSYSGSQIGDALNYLNQTENPKFIEPNKLYFNFFTYVGQVYDHNWLKGLTDENFSMEQWKTCIKFTHALLNNIEKVYFWDTPDADRFALDDPETLKFEYKLSHLPCYHIDFNIAEVMRNYQTPPFLIKKVVMPQFNPPETILPILPLHKPLIQIPKLSSLPFIDVNFLIPTAKVADIKAILKTYRTTSPLRLFGKRSSAIKALEQMLTSHKDDALIYKFNIDLIISKHKRQPENSQYDTDRVFKKILDLFNKNPIASPAKHS